MGAALNRLELAVWMELVLYLGAVVMGDDFGPEHRARIGRTHRAVQVGLWTLALSGVWSWLAP